MQSRWRPFLLGAVYKTFGRSPLDHPLKRKYVIEVDAPRMARRIGLELKFPTNFPEHSLPPSRAFYWIEQRDKAVYCRYWLEGSATGDPRPWRPMRLPPSVAIGMQCWRACKTPHKVPFDP